MKKTKTKNKIIIILILVLLLFFLIVLFNNYSPSPSPNPTPSPSPSPQKLNLDNINDDILKKFDFNQGLGEVGQILNKSLKNKILEKCLPSDFEDEKFIVELNINKVNTTTNHFFLSLMIYHFNYNPLLAVNEDYYNYKKDDELHSHLKEKDILSKDNLKFIIMGSTCHYTIYYSDDFKETVNKYIHENHIQENASIQGELMINNLLPSRCTNDIETPNGGKYYLLHKFKDEFKIIEDNMKHKIKIPATGNFCYIYAAIVAIVLFLPDDKRQKFIDCIYK